MTDDKQPIIYSGEWWHSRNDAQLDEILKGSFPGSNAFAGAVTEMDRRSALKREKKDRRIAFWGMVAAVIAAVASVAALFR